MDNKSYVLSLSYGKDSLACLGAIEKLGLPLDRIIHAEVWATPTIPAEFPEMIEFKKKADKIIKDRWGIEVEHFKADVSYEEQFYKKRYNKKLNKEIIYGFPMIRGAWCNSNLKMAAINNALKSIKNSVQYIGIAIDEPNRFHNFNEDKKSPLVEIGWTEEDCKQWCIENNLLSPIYSNSTRGGCWFCHNQSIDQLRKLRKNYPEYWELMLKWDKDSPVTFKPDGHTVQDFDKRFQLEDEEYIDLFQKFKWKMIENTYKQLEF